MKPSWNPRAGAVLTLALLAVCATGTTRAARAPARPPKTAARAPGLVPPFIDDNYARALAQARARKLPIFIEAWAPW
jgi:hypothetical protein